ncbi:MAG: Nramp family divalent metal transporter, partial [Gemmatimonadales bacterium]
ARTGSALLWCVAFATVATIVLQEMAARLGIVTGAGIGAGLSRAGGKAGKGLAWLAVVSVLVGVVAYEAGNLTGAGLGLGAAAGVQPKYVVLVSAVLAGLLLWSGRYRLIERVLVVCVAIMGLVFFATALMVLPSVPGLLRGLTIPSLPDGATLTALGLVGTTIVPYNLFLHAAAVNERFSGQADLQAVRRDLYWSVALGGVITAAIVVTAAAALDGAAVRSAGDMAGQLEPLLGPWASRAFTLGLAAAGLSSAITAPLAAAYALLDLLGRGRATTHVVARATFLTALAVGAAIAYVGTRPVPLILAAQALNGLMLPLVAAALLVAMNSRTLLGDAVNGGWRNMAGVAVVLLCAALGIRAIAAL